MTCSTARIRAVKPLSFIYEVTQALAADVCLEAIRRFEARTDQQYPAAAARQARRRRM